jgi:multisubunit Na+/H+ antiporter MnhG subunit
MFLRSFQVLLLYFLDFYVRMHMDSEMYYTINLIQLMPLFSLHWEYNKSHRINDFYVRMHGTNAFVFFALGIQ